MKKQISVYVTQEDYSFLKSRQVSMSQWIRTSIKFLKSREAKNLEHYNNKYKTDKVFREKELKRVKAWREE